MSLDNGMSFDNGWGSKIMNSNNDEILDMMSSDNFQGNEFINMN